MNDLPEIKVEKIVVSADKPFGIVGQCSNGILKWLHDHWDDEIVYFDTKEMRIDVLPDGPEKTKRKKRFHRSMAIYSWLIGGVVLAVAILIVTLLCVFSARIVG